MKPCCLSAAQLNNLKQEVLVLQQQLTNDLEVEQQDQQDGLNLINPSEVMDRGEEAAVAGQQFSNLSHVTRLTEEIRECDHALQRIEDGEYGCCATCGEEIELNRLMANPVALLCISCQSREEGQRQVASF